MLFVAKLDIRRIQQELSEFNLHHLREISMVFKMMAVLTQKLGIEVNLLKFT